jgi:hypothetical protein
MDKGPGRLGPAQLNVIAQKGEAGDGMKPGGHRCREPLPPGLRAI